MAVFYDKLMLYFLKTIKLFSNVVVKFYIQYMCSN